MIAEVEIESGKLSLLLRFYIGRMLHRHLLIKKPSRAFQEHNLPLHLDIAVKVK